jgi:DeoR/GlpR family transcriptional regulator of sugar metabolism
MLRSLHADKGFFSASGLTLTRGFTDADIREVEMKRAMLAAASQVYVLLDASKFDQQSFLSFAPLSAIHYLITEAGIPPEYVAACQQLGITLSIV